MKPARIILLLVAIIAGGLAAFLVTRGGRAPTTQIVTNEVIQQEAKTQILVAKSQIGMGERLGPASLEWQHWPESALRPEYVTIAAMPAAITINTVVAKYRPVCNDVRPIPFIRMAGAAANEANSPLIKRLIESAGRMNRLSSASRR